MRKVVHGQSRPNNLVPNPARNRYAEFGVRLNQNQPRPKRKAFNRRSPNS